MTDQIAINMLPTPSANTLPLDIADGRKPRDRHQTNENQHHSTNGQHHHLQNGRRRSRSRSRSRTHSQSRTPSPSHTPSHSSRRGKRDADAGKTPGTEKDVTTATNDVEPLLVNKVPRKHSHTELDEDSNDEDNLHQSPQPGVDDGFFANNPAPNDGTDPEKGIPDFGDERRGIYPHQGNPPKFPYAPAYDPNIIVDGNGNPQVIPDINVYQQKKNLAQGMMDLALLSANANQMRYILESYDRHPYYWFSVISISISLILQVAVGVGLILNSRYNVKNRDQICRADKINNFTIIGIFLITIVNVFVSAFGVADPMDPKL